MKNIMATKLLTQKILLVLLFVLASCSNKSFESQSSTAPTQQIQNGNNQDDQQDQGAGSGSETPQPQPQVPPSGPTLDGIDLKSQVEDNSNQLGFNGAVAFDFDKVRGEFIVMIPLPKNIFFTPVGSFSKYPDITFAPVFDQTSGKMKMALRIPIKYVLKGVTIGEPTKLPNGDSLPMMPAGKGELPSMALNFPSHNDMQLHLYIGVNAIGLYISLPKKSALPLPFNITAPIKSKDKTRTVGFLTYVTAKNDHAPGIFVSSIIPGNIARALEDYFHL